MLISNYTNQLNSSLRLFLDNLLCKNGGFTNNTGRFFPSSDPNYSQYDIFATPFRQFVGDSSISGAIICSGVNDVGNGVWNEVYQYWNLNENYWNGSTGSLLSVDFERGRVITDYMLNAPVIGSYAFKTWNIFFNFLSEPEILIERAFEIQSQVPQATGALNWNAEPINAIYVQNKYEENTPWAFGGTDRSDTIFSLVLLTQDSFTLDSTLSILANSSKKYFPLFSVADLPYGVLGDLKSGYYNYDELCMQQNSANLVYINRVKISKFTPSLSKMLDKGIRGAFVDIDVQLPRSPRRYYP